MTQREKNLKAIADYELWKAQMEATYGKIDYAKEAK